MNAATALQTVDAATTRRPIMELIRGHVRYGSSGPDTVADVSISLHPGEILGLVGESGCGKSTTARAMLGMVPLRTGRLQVDGSEVQRGDPRLTGTAQAIFQNPAASFNPKRSLLDSVAEPLRVRGQGNRRDRTTRALAELDRVGLTETMARRRPQEVSGGQCQRAAIARATILRPRVLVCDEPVSALDVSIQAQILALLAELRDEHQLAMLFISHDLGVVAALCDRTAVMYAGGIVEEGDSMQIAQDPRHPYSVLLQDSVPSLDLSAGTTLRLTPRIVDEDVDVRRLPGCRFATTCPSVQQDCTVTPPELTPRSDSHLLACLHPFLPSERPPS